MKVQVDLAAFNRAMGGMERQMPYAVSLALNRVANRAQGAERQHMREVFKLRREQFVLRGVKIAKADRATKTSWSVVIQLAYPDQRPFMDMHEGGGQRQRHGGGRLWQPNESVFKSKVIGRQNPLHPKNLKLRKVGGKLMGAQGTFVVKTGGQVLVLQRVGRGLTAKSKRTMRHITLDNFAGGMGPRAKGETKSLERTAGTRLLYRLVSRVTIPAELQFLVTIAKTVTSTWNEEARRAMDEAMRSAR